MGLSTKKGMQIKAAIFGAIMLVGLAGAFYLSQNRTQLDSQAALETLSEIKRWDFNTASDFGGWKYNGLSSAQVKDGVIMGSMTSGTADISNTGLNLNPLSSGYYRVVVKVKNPTVRSSPTTRGSTQPRVVSDMKGGFNTTAGYGANVGGSQTTGGSLSAVQLQYREADDRNYVASGKVDPAGKISENGYTEYTFNLNTNKPSKAVVGFVVNFAGAARTGLSVDSIVVSSVIVSDGRTGVGSSPRPGATGGACPAVIVSAKNSSTGECKQFSSPCNVPSGWQTVSSCGTATPRPTSTTTITKPTPTPHIYTRPATPPPQNYYRSPSPAPVKVVN